MFGSQCLKCTGRWILSSGPRISHCSFTARKLHLTSTRHAHTHTHSPLDDCLLSWPGYVTLASKSCREAAKAERDPASATVGLVLLRHDVVLGLVIFRMDDLRKRGHVYSKMRGMRGAARRGEASGKMSSQWMGPVPPSGGRSTRSADTRKLSWVP